METVTLRADPSRVQTEFEQHPALADAGRFAMMLGGHADSSGSDSGEPVTFKPYSSASGSPSAKHDSMDLLY